MPGLNQVPVLTSWRISGALAAGATVQRKLIPFDHEVVGAAITASTAPVGADLIVDILHGANGAAAGALASIWHTNNGANGNPDNRPRLVAGNLDQAARPAGSTTVRPEGTDPALSGQSTGVSTTYVNYDELPFLSVPDANPAGYGFAGNQPVNEGQNPVQINPQESGGPQQQSAPANVGFRGKAGDVYVPSIVQVGSTTPGSDLEIILLLMQV